MPTDYALTRYLITLAAMVMEDAVPDLLIDDGTLTANRRVAVLQSASTSLAALMQVVCLSQRYENHDDRQ